MVNKKFYNQKEEQVCIFELASHLAIFMKYVLLKLKNG